MVGTGSGIGRRQGRVDRRPELGGDLGGRNPLQGGVEQRLQARLGLVDQFAHGRPFLLRHGAHLLHQRGELAIRPDQAGLGGLEVRARGQRGEIGLRLGHEGGEGGLHEG